jgi:glycerol-3-phosphate dehydrogenase
VLANLEAAVERGGRFETYSKVTAMHLARGRVRGIHYRNTRTGEERDVSCELAINAAGGWAQEIAALAKIDVPVRCDKGTLLVVNHRLNNRVINRCRQPGDADILVPGGPVCILGTSSMHVPGPDGLAISPEEINELVRLGDVMVPGLAEARILRAFCGVRPLYALSLAKELGGREISRGFSLIDHKAQDGLDGLVSIIGGKLTTYRLMAAAVCDCVAAKLGVAAECHGDDAAAAREPTEDTPAQHRHASLGGRGEAEQSPGRAGGACAGCDRASSGAC